MIYIPKYVRQDSDLAYGEKVTHENYNEKLNLNSTQGDYNTEVLNALFNNEDIESTYHIPYIDNMLSAQDDRITTAEGDIDNLERDYDDFRDDFSGLENTVDNIIQGDTTVGRALLAGNVAGALTAGPSKYYGTDENSVPGFIDLPEFIYAEELSQTASVEGIYFTPMLNSVAESMLTAEVREKLNREAVVDYDYLDNRPKINSVTLTGNKSLADLGIQPVGDFVTNSALTSTLSSYYTITAAQAYVTNQLANYATTSALSGVSSVANSASTTATSAYNRAYACARVGVNSYPSSPQTGDLYFAV